MNVSLVIRQLGLLLIVLSMSMVVCAIATWLMPGVQEQWIAERSLLFAALIGAVTGASAWFVTRRGAAHLGRREAMLLVALSWIVGAALAAAPFFVWAHWDPAAGSGHRFWHAVDCYFEAMSGLTTTGATVLGDEGSRIEALPPSLLLWRSTTHWLGGLGIVVLFVAVLPSLGAGGKRLFRVEAPGPTHEGLRPHIRETARVLLLIYLGITLAEILLLLPTKMDLFDAINHTLSTVSTGGFSTKDTSIGYYQSVAIDLIVSFFMLVAGMNFTVFYQMTQGRFSVLWKDVELRAYLVLKVAAIILITWNVTGRPTVTTTMEIADTSVGQALQHSTFVTASMQTGTGFCNADYELWPFFSQALTIGLLFMGGCAGSTAGGVKVIRAWIAFKVMLGEIEKAFRPNVVRPIKVGGSALDSDIRLGAVTYVLGLLAVFVVGAILLRLFEGPACDFPTAMTASLSTICNVGPGLGRVGVTQNYGWFGADSKILMSLLMALGRLEFFAILVLVLPRFWKAD